MGHIIAMGGGGFSMEPDNPALDQYVIQQSGKAAPKVCFLAQASSESLEYTVNFYRAFNRLGCSASHLSLFKPHTADIAGFLGEQDIIYVGGGNTKSMLALWREWGLDVTLKQLNENGTLLAGISAGAICWFTQGLTDSIFGQLIALPCLGYLPFSATPHYDGEPGRRPAFQARVGSGELMAGYAFDDCAAGHFVDGALVECVSSRPNTKGYFVEKQGDGVSETPLEMRYLGAES
ncbi:MAG: peptidase E [Burkholderiales bacterium]|nr:peptidase E [Anaerolineae bacterium]